MIKIEENLESNSISVKIDKSVTFYGIKSQNLAELKRMLIETLTRELIVEIDSLAKKQLLKD